MILLAHSGFKEYVKNRSFFSVESDHFCVTQRNRLLCAVIIQL